MEFIRQTIPDVILVQPKIHGDDRGYFLETFRQDLFEKFVGQKIKFIQDNESKSSKGVLRGLHYQLTPYAQAKLVRVIEGSVLDVAVDIRPSSPTFGKYVAVKLTSQNKQQLFIPQGFAHGFVVLSQSAIFSYKVDNYYNLAQEQGIAYNDPQLAIDWQLPKQQLQLSEKDRGFPDFNSISH